MASREVKKIIAVICVSFLLIFTVSQLSTIVQGLQDRLDSIVHVSNDRTEKRFSHTRPNSCINGNTNWEAVQIPKDSQNKISTLMQVPYLHSKCEDFGNNSYLKKAQRLEELTQSIQNHLNYEYIGYVYIFYQDSALINYIQQQNLSNSQFLIFVPNPKDTTDTVFRFANNKLQGKVVMVSNADNYPAAGFEQFKPEYLKREKLMYTLSRHGRKEKYCNLTGVEYSNKCTRNAFGGSMDAYIFVPTSDFNEEHYKLLEYRTRNYGIENVISWCYKQNGYRLLNPCEILKIYHVHCGVRIGNRTRINRGGHSAFAVPTNELY